MSEQDLYEFMRSRNIDESIIAKFEEEKIVSETIIQMTDTELATFIPLYGDRMAVSAFSRDKKGASQKKQKTKASLMEKLRSKVNAIKGNTSSSGDDDGDSIDRVDGSFSALRKKMKGNKNAEKKNRKVELSCYHLEGNTYHQVRGNKGGGHKSFQMEKSSKMVKVLELGKQLYFPNGYNTIRGDVTEYEISLTDTYFQEIDLQSTLESYFNRLKMRQLKFNFCTKFKASVQLALEEEVEDSKAKKQTEFPFEQIKLNNITETTPTERGQDDLPDLRQPFKSKDQNIKTFAPESQQDYLPNLRSPLKSKVQNISETAATQDDSPVFLHLVQSEFQKNNEETVPQIQQDDLPCFVPFVQREVEVHEKTDQPIFTFADFAVDEEVTFRFIHDSASNMTLDSMFHVPAECSNAAQGQSGSTCIQIRIHRGSVLMELISYFKDPAIMDPSTSMNVKMILENGEEEAGEGDGVFRDCLSQFWQEFYDHCSEGRVFKVPVLRHDFQKEEWRAVSRIIKKGFGVCGYWPISILPAIFEECLHGKIESNLIDLYADFLPEMEMRILKVATSNFSDVDLEDLLDFLDSHSCRKLVTAENVSQVFGELAHKELIQQPRYVIECFRTELQEMVKLISPEKLKALYLELKPKAKNVLTALKFNENLSTAERECMGFLKKYIKEMDEEKLRAFLRFCTGADVILGMNITVEFFEISGFTRSPIAHTCGRILKVPSTYENYPTFRTEFNNLLGSKIWVMDIV